MGGTHVQYERGKYSTFFGYFFRGTDIHDLYYFTTGPNKMKDIRLVPLSDGKIGVFSLSEEVVADRDGPRGSVAASPVSGSSSSKMDRPLSLMGAKPLPGSVW